jgi:L-threonylcarbamoyladenylate synthase
MDDVDRAVQSLRAGRLVAFPTETVYGLGADATNAAAVRRIFAAKGRPATNPLIAHVASVEVARRYAASWPESAERLARAFWPGPLSIVLPKTDAIVAEVSAGRATVGLRVPNHPLALELLRAFDGPVAAPSANRSNRISPTTAQHVREEIGDAVDLILDGGPCAVGIESTVIDLSTARPTLLRPGGASRDAIEAVIGPVDVFTGSVGHDVAAASPGQQSVHYAPATPAYRFDAAQRPSVPTTNVDVGCLTIGDQATTTCHGPRVAMANRPDDYAHDLYRVLRELDAMRLTAIYIEFPPDKPAWAAVRDRITRATRPLGRT